MLVSDFVFRNQIQWLFWAVRRLIVKYREGSKPREIIFILSDHCEIWQGLQPMYCRDACQISGEYNNFNVHTSRFEISR